VLQLELCEVLVQNKAIGSKSLFVVQMDAIAGKELVPHRCTSPELLRCGIGFVLLPAELRCPKQAAKKEPEKLHDPESAKHPINHSH
jgi:hypothetical protein